MKIVVAVPVASPGAVKKLSEIADDVVVVFKPSQFFGVGAFYEGFARVSDEEVICFMNKLKEAGKAGSPNPRA